VPRTRIRYLSRSSVCTWPRVAVLTAGLLSALTASASAQTASRPTVGVALSGGGAKGLAHIGVLRVLDDIGLQVDVVAGTSMGNIVGALYAIGYSPDEIEHLSLTVDWHYVFSDEVPLRAVGIEQKSWARTYIGAIPFRNGRPELPSGLLAGQNVTRLLARLTIPAHGVEDFDSLPRPFAAVAADIVTGEAVRITRGDLADAVQASGGLPTVFMPMRFDGRLLVDGGIVRNLPVEDALAIGADIVIAVDVGQPLRSEDEIRTFLDVMDQVIAFQGASSTREQRELADILIAPDIEGLSILGFDDIPEIIRRGEEAARAQLPALIALVDSLNALGSPGSIPALAQPDSFYVTRLGVEGADRIPAATVIDASGIRAPVWLTIHDLDQAVNRIYGRETFRRVGYELTSDAAGSTLTFRVVEDVENLVRFGLRFDTQTGVAVQLGTLFRNVGLDGSLLTADFRVGRESRLDAQYWLGSGLRSGFAPRLRVVGSLNEFDLYVDTERVAQLDSKYVAGSLDAGTFFSRVVAAIAGLRGEYLDVSPDIAPIGSPSQNGWLGLAYGSVTADTYDRVQFPSSGLRGTVGAELGGQSVTAGGGVRRAFLNFQGALPVTRRLSLLTQLFMGSAGGDSIPLPYQFFLGGLEAPAVSQYPGVSRVSFLGMRYQELRGRAAQFLMLGAQLELKGTAYVLLRANAGNAFDEWEVDLSSERFESGIGLTIGASTIGGPLSLTLATGSRHDFLATLSLGFTF
jgi:NTE family protein